jgi:hypothetical protein
MSCNLSQDKISNDDKQVKPIIHEINKPLDILIIEKRLNRKIQELKTYYSKNPTYNYNIAFLIDMKIISSRNRFFVVDMNSLKIN